MPKSPDDLEGLKAERAAADREYNDSLTRLDAAIQKLPASFPHPLPGPNAHQVAPLNVLWKIAAPPPESGIRGRVAAAVRRIVAPLFAQQQATSETIDGTLTCCATSSPSWPDATPSSSICSRSRRMWIRIRAIATSPGFCAVSLRRSTRSPTS